MQNLEIYLINLFMIGEIFSDSPHGGFIKDTTKIECDNFIFEFKQHDINLKQKKFINETRITTTVTVHNIKDSQLKAILSIVDDLCWLLSFALQSPIHRQSYKINSRAKNSINCSEYTINPPNYIIENRGQYIRQFIEQVYPTFKKLKSSRELTVVFGYLLEINQPKLAVETKLIISYVLIEQLKRTYAEMLGYINNGNRFEHPEYPDLEARPEDIENYKPFQSRNNFIYRHKQFGKCGSNEMIKRVFEHVNISREETKNIIEKRNQMIHEGLLLPFGDKNYMVQAIKDFHSVNNLLREYLLNILNYKGEYYLSSDRLSSSVCIL
ncbi:MAG: hypothetical protein H9855_04770 [Candidatus Acinetobacter avistercoris]|uniref:hypothetical protein n=1 Tax=Acinetobacter sp. KS-LM10 TaxID=3120518 RepID=UPI001FA3219F|nr:hypothetical protein [Candidatus Acinetobacter avistercoris]